MSDKDKVLQVCTRIDKVLQRDWGGSGKTLADKLKTSKYKVPGHLAKRIRFLADLQRKAIKQVNFRLKSGDDFVRKGLLVIEELTAARASARRRLRPWMIELARTHRVVTALLGLTVVAVPALLFFLLQPPPEPEFPPIRQVRRAAPKPAVRPASAAIVADAAAAAAAALPGSQAPAPANAPETVAPAVDPDALPNDLPAGTRVFIEAPQSVGLTVKRTEIMRTTNDRPEVAVIVEVQNLGYDSLKRITFDSWLYDMSDKAPVAIISPSRNASAAPPWYAFLRQAVKRGQTVEVRLNYPADSIWGSDKVLEVVKSGHYLIRLKAVTLSDAQDKSLPF